METTFIFGIDLLVPVPTTLRSVWVVSDLASKRLPAQQGVGGKQTGKGEKIIPT